MDTGSLLGLTWGFIAGWTAWRTIFHIMWSLWAEDRDIRWQEHTARMEQGLFQAMQDAGILEVKEETIH